MINHGGRKEIYARCGDDDERGEWGPETEPQYTIYQGNDMIVDKKPNDRRILDFSTVTVPKSQEGRKRN